VPGVLRRLRGSSRLRDGDVGTQAVPACGAW
jgi:hypothetical protein